MVNTAINHYHKKKIHFDPIDEETLVVAEEEEEVFSSHRSRGFDVDDTDLARRIQNCTEPVCI